MKTLETLKIESPQEHTVLVTLNRPEVANAMNTQMGLDLLETFDGFCARPNAQRCIVITGSGPKAFCAGGDLKQRNGMTDEQWMDQHLIFERAIRAMIDCPVPMIAAVNGRPVSMISFARRAPTARGRFCVPPAPGMMPNVTSVSANRACSAA